MEDPDPPGFGRLLIILGVVLLLVGIGLSLGTRIPWLGRLPGDFSFGGGSWRVYVPLGTSILISLLLTLLFWIFGRK
jgi:hypothetical protein